MAEIPKPHSSPQPPGQPPAFRMRRGLDEFELRWIDSRKPAEDTPGTVPFHEEVSALVFLKTCIRDPFQKDLLRNFLEHPLEYGLTNPDLAGDEIERTAHWIVEGKLTVILIGNGVAGGLGGIIRLGEGGAGGASGRRSPAQRTPLQDEMASRSQAAAADEIVLGESEEPQKQSWIEIELVDKNGQPVPYERFKLTLPDGSVKWGRLDHAARARVNKLQEGTCQVTFPDRDQEVWDVA